MAHRADTIPNRNGTAQFPVRFLVVGWLISAVLTVPLLISGGLFEIYLAIDLPIVVLIWAMGIYMIRLLIGVCGKHMPSTALITGGAIGFLFHVLFLVALLSIYAGFPPFVAYFSVMIWGPVLLFSILAAGTVGMLVRWAARQVGGFARS
jgi:hypothetical protein